MRLHKERAVEQGAEGGIIPAPPQPETTHLQTMMEKQKRLYSPSRMPPPELRRRAEVQTLSPDELKGKGDASPSSAPVQRSVTGGTEATPPTATPERAIEEANASRLAAASETATVQRATPDVAVSESQTLQPPTSDAAAPETATVQRATPEADTPPTLQRQAGPSSEPTTSALEPAMGQTEPEGPSAQPIVQTQAEPAATPQIVQPIMKESEAIEPPRGFASSTATTSDAAALPMPATSAPIQRQRLTPPTTSTPGPIVVPTAEITQPPDVTPAAAETPVQRSLVEPSTTSATPQPEVHSTAATAPSDSSTPIAEAKPSTSEVTPPVQRQETTSSGELVEATTPAMPIIPSAPSAPVLAAPAIQRQELPASKPMTPVTATPGHKPAISQLTEGTLTGQPSAVPETVATPTPVQRQTMAQEQAETLSRQIEPAATVMSSASPAPVNVPLPDEGPQHPAPPSVPTIPATAPATVQRQADSSPMVAEAGELRASAPEASQPVPDVTPVQRASANVPSSSTVDMPLPVVRARPVSEMTPSSAPTYQRMVESGEALPPGGLETTHPAPPAAATSSRPDVLPTMPTVAGSEAVTPLQRAAATPPPPASPLTSPMTGTESVMPVQRAAATSVPTISPSATPVAKAELVPPVVSASPVSTASPDVLPVTQSEGTSPVQRAAASMPPSGVAETDMPTMIMPVPAVASQSTPASSAEVAGTNQGVEPAVQRLAESVSPTVTSRSPEISRPVQPPAIPSTERLALEDVWPVQRKETGVSKAGDLPLDPIEAAEPVRHEKPEEAQIQQVMRQVAAAKTSDSSVELILPRRQRPATPARPATPPPAVQTQPAAPAAKDGNGNNGQGDGPSRTTQAYVPTEIGPLPGDLWEILGAPVPSPMGPTGQTGSPALMRTVAAAESTVPFPEPANRYPGSAPTTGTNGYTNGHTNVVQREVTPATGPSQPSSVATVQSGMPTRTASAQEGGEQGAEAGEQGEVNVEELARQVYSEVKRRIAVDWERGRGRF
jgi:hypothetical protein